MKIDIVESLMEMLGRGRVLNEVEYSNKKMRSDYNPQLIEEKAFKELIYKAKKGEMWSALELNRLKSWFKKQKGNYGPFLDFLKQLNFPELPEDRIKDNIAAGIEYVIGKLPQSMLAKDFGSGPTISNKEFMMSVYPTLVSTAIKFALGGGNVEKMKEKGKEFKPENFFENLKSLLNLRYRSWQTKKENKLKGGSLNAPTPGFESDSENTPDLVDTIAGDKDPEYELGSEKAKIDAIQQEKYKNYTPEDFEREKEKVFQNVRIKNMVKVISDTIFQKNEKLKQQFVNAWIYTFNHGCFESGSDEDKSAWYRKEKKDGTKTVSADTELGAGEEITHQDSTPYGVAIMPGETLKTLFNVKDPKQLAWKVTQQFKPEIMRALEDGSLAAAFRSLSMPLPPEMKILCTDVKLNRAGEHINARTRKANLGDTQKVIGIVSGLSPAELSEVKQIIDDFSNSKEWLVTTEMKDDTIEIQAETADQIRAINSELQSVDPGFSISIQKRQLAEAVNNDSLRRLAVLGGAIKESYTDKFFG